MNIKKIVTVAFQTKQPHNSFTLYCKIALLKFTVYQHRWLDLGKLTELSHWAYSILLAQLMATLVRYTYTVPLPGLVDWSAFLEHFCRPCKFTTETMGPMEGGATWKAWVWNSPQWWDVFYAIQACLGIWLALLGLASYQVSSSICTNTFYWKKSYFTSFNFMLNNISIYPSACK